MGGGTRFAASARNTARRALERLARSAAQARSLIAGALKKVAPVAESLGVELRLEAHGSVGLLPHLQTLAQAVGKPGIRVILNSDFRDTKGEGLAANLEKVAPLLAGTVHIHDLTAPNYAEAKFYETQFAFLKRIGWDGFCMLEIGDNEVHVAADLAKRAQVPIRRMLDFAAALKKTAAAGACPSEPA